VRKIVDVFVRDKLVASYPVVVNYAPEDIAVARFTVR
jgi:hypothetical protein